MTTSIGSAAMPAAATAHRAIRAKSEDADAGTAVATRPSSPKTSLQLPIAIAGGVGLAGGLAMTRFGPGPVRGIGIGLAALGGATLGVSLLSACAPASPSSPSSPTPSSSTSVPGDDGPTNGKVSWYPSSLKYLERNTDTTNPAPADYEPRISNSARDAREGVVMIDHSEATGSGWVVRPGTVITNYHVAQGHRDLNVLDHDGKWHQGTLRMLDSEHDLALVDVPTLEDAPLPMDDVVDLVETGEITGYPDGRFQRSYAAAMGTATVLDGTKTRERQELVFMGDAGAGASGGAIINGANEVVGTVFAGGTRDFDFKGGEDTDYTLAIPNDQVRDFLARADAAAG